MMLVVVDKGGVGAGTRQGLQVFFFSGLQGVTLSRLVFYGIDNWTPVQ